VEIRAKVYKTPRGCEVKEWSGYANSRLWFVLNKTSDSNPHFGRRMNLNHIGLLFLMLVSFNWQIVFGVPKGSSPAVRIDSVYKGEDTLLIAANPEGDSIDTLDIVHNDFLNNRVVNYENKRKVMMASNRIVCVCNYKQNSSYVIHDEYLLRIRNGEVILRTPLKSWSESEFKEIINSHG